jgi:Tfp pilus assembly protein PilO
MKEIFELLDRKDRTVLGVLCLMLVFALFFLLVFALGEKRVYTGSLERLASIKEEAQEAEALRQDKDTEWRKWQGTFDDIEELKSKYFYKEDDGITQLIRDTQQIINSAGLRVYQKRYDYADLKKGEYRMVRVMFDTTGSYTALKKFIHSVESFSRFLVVQKIDFLDVDPLAGGFKIKVTLVGFYE